MGSTFDHYIELDQGQLVLGSIKPGAGLRFYTAGPLELVMEHSTELTYGEPNRTQNTFSYSIQWLEGSEADSLQQLEAPIVIDAESLDGEITYDIERAFCVAARGSVVKVIAL
jgi:hypothetical protein